MTGDRLSAYIRRAGILALAFTLSGCPGGERLGTTTAAGVTTNSVAGAASRSGTFTEVGPGSGTTTSNSSSAPLFGGIGQQDALAPGSLAVYAASSGPVVADSRGLFRFAAGGFSPLGPVFPENSPPAAIAVTASGSVIAAGQSGLYTLTQGVWSLSASASYVTDLAMTPDGSFGLAVQGDGATWTFDGRAWNPGPVLSAPLGGVAVVSATESYVVGQGLLDEWNGQAFEPIAQPDPSNPVAGLAVAPGASGSVLVATTRASLWERSGGTWLAAPGQASSSILALGIPSVASGSGIVTEIGNASPSVYLFDGLKWSSGPSPAQPLDTVAIANPGNALAMTADGSALLELSGGTWTAIAAP